MMFKRYGLLLATALLVAACGVSSEPSESGLHTQLGSAGNSEVRDGLRAYGAKSEHCERPSDPDVKRVIITGFSLFGSSARNAAGVPYNISGVIAGSLGDEHYSNTRETSSGDAHFSHLTATDLGAKVRQRRIVINGIEISFCTIVLEVRWDLAAAIILEEARHFDADFILMTGLSGGRAVTLEGAASNDALQLEGYHYDGRPDAYNRPVVMPNESHAPVLAPGTSGVADEIRLGWDTELLAEETAAIAEQIRSSASPHPLGFHMVAAPRARVSNNYICNNVAFVVAAARNGASIELAGGSLRFSPNPTPEEPAVENRLLLQKLSRGDTAIGFIHLPAAPDDSTVVQGFHAVYGKIIEVVLNL